MDIFQCSTVFLLHNIFYLETWYFVIFVYFKIVLILETKAY